MTEKEWLTCSDAILMLELLNGTASDRKLRLLAVACCRRIWHLLRDERSRNAIDVADQHADGLATDLELLYASDRAYDKVCVGIAEEPLIRLDPPTSTYDADIAAANSAWPNISSAITIVIDLASAAENINSAHDNLPIPSKKRAAQCDLLRDIFGNPFRPVSIDPSWLQCTVNAAATHAYDDRAYDRLPALADALEEAGCDNADILAHCRQSGPHVRGCWVVDLILGKS